MTLRSRIFLCLIAGIFVAGIGAFFARNYLGQMINAYVAQATEKELGSQSLNSDQEAKIKNIAVEIGITEPIIIRKMNQKAMITFGYHNAFAYFPLLLTFIPTNSSPYLFISEGFLEDLSPEEQRFLIGHEMVHIKERHTLYLNLVLYSLFLLLAALAYFLTKRIQRLAQGLQYQKYIMGGASGVLVFICLSITNIIGLAYRKHIEKVADCQSLKILKSYEGCTKLVTRWQKEFNLPAHNPCYGLFSDHPSCEERKLYCKEMQNNSKETV
jgi:Zn-dependent protease with chaperone function